MRKSRHTFSFPADYVPAFILLNYPNKFVQKPFHFVTTIRIVLLLIPKAFAACLTVALLSTI